VRHIEHQHQVALISWARRTRVPDADDVMPKAVIADYLLAIPNGGHRNVMEAVRLKREGVKAGVSDLLLPLQRQGYGGLWLELKAPGNKPTKHQRSWLDIMTVAGYRAEWADDWVKASMIILDYVS